MFTVGLSDDLSNFDVKFMVKQSEKKEFSKKGALTFVTVKTCSQGLGNLLCR